MLLQLVKAVLKRGSCFLGNTYFEQLLRMLYVILFLSGGSIVNASDATIVPSGNFIRAIGNQLYFVNFEKSTNELLYSFPVGTIIGEKISQIDSKRLLLSLPTEGRILTINFETKDIQNVGVGLNPVYLSEHGKIIYYGKDTYGNGAVLVSSIGMTDSKKIVDLGKYDPLKIVKVSDDEVVFQKSEAAIGSDSRKNVLWKFNIRTNGLTKLDAIRNCRLLNVWRSYGEQLICERITKDRFDSYYYLVDLNGSVDKKIDVSGYLNIGAYLDEMDAIIIQKIDVDNKGQ